MCSEFSASREGLMKATMIRLAVALACSSLPWVPSIAASAEVNDWHLLEPIWASPVVYGESVLFIKDGDAAPTARLALRPKKIRQVTMANRSQVFNDGDYTIDTVTRTLTLTSKS